MEIPIDTIPIVQKISSSDSVIAAKQISDTVFLFKEVKKGYYHTVFIEKNRSSKYYTWLKNFKFDEWEQESYESMKATFSKEEAKNRKSNTSIDLPQHWLPLYQYKNNYYLYAPSDWGNAGKRILKDREFIYWYMTGPYPASIVSAKKTTRRKYELILENRLEDSLSTEPMIVHLLDPVTKLSVFEYPNQTMYRYQLYVPAENADRYELIVNDCKQQKQLEFEFEAIDYKKLLKTIH